ncbi:hypothetical protein LEP1GSC161_3667 [Leptospira santarosai str. CBC1416]|uniref:Uncharacterized protein n=3 Tax=Leptospira santarosai TaxID=28183 RepID=K8XZK0_9LEPT|nr:hypothetical protein LEP1GSC179_1066 [Leptospira santarosai str. MOR084]EKO79331.1 hypothetical protein LEP1GSC068_0773 [Leptospira sp. Fiocruz LV3954]EKR92777.1 hypothetical protein LEP1GSC163_1979 [Leptospira santarosai str. CBC379]EKS09742.1 hypothetical protein LEP1GSC071_1251 [Leptospira santarosai str. JET]EKT86739.1 hypothetical protein LSS_10798 [Leptospira santarosai serovar Shermani str. LT 821]EMI61126.1 hypothetical protein LEP1GSC076_2058 [Leptospira sp. Fiocruz LV4135]EMM8542
MRWESLVDCEFYERPKRKGFGEKNMQKEKKPEDSFEYSGFRVVRRFITGIINPF